MNEEMLRELGTYLKDTATACYRFLAGDGESTVKDEETADVMMDLAKQLQVIRYSPLLFQSILEQYDVPFEVLIEPLERVPLYVNQEGITKVLIEWRLQKGV